MHMLIRDASLVKVANGSPTTTSILAHNMHSKKQSRG